MKIFAKTLLPLCLIIFVMIGLVACQNEAGQPESLVATHYLKQAQQYRSPGANLTLINSQVNLDLAGVQYAVDIDIDSGYGDGDMTVSVSTSEGLYIVAGNTDIMVSLNKGKIKLPFDLIASEVGRYYVYINVKVQSDSEVSGRALTFIVQVGKEETKREAQQAITGSGVDVLIPMPVEEEIIP